MTVGVMSVGEIPVGVMTIEVMRRPHFITTKVMSSISPIDIYHIQLFITAFCLEPCDGAFISMFLN